VEVCLQLISKSKVKKKKSGFPKVVSTILTGTGSSTTSKNTASEILAMPTLQLTITQIHTPPEPNPEPTSFPEPDPEPGSDPSNLPADEPDPATGPEPTPSTLPPELDPESPSGL
jgi:molecular chaperone DnaK